MIGWWKTLPTSKRFPTKPTCWVEYSKWKVDLSDTLYSCTWRGPKHGPTFVFQSDSEPLSVQFFHVIPILLTKKVMNFSITNTVLGVLAQSVDWCHYPFGILNIIRYIEGGGGMAQCDHVAVWPSGWGACLEIRRCRVQDPLWPLIEFVPGSPWFNFPAALVNSQLVCLQPVGILNSKGCCCSVPSFRCVSMALKSPYGEQSIKYVLYCIVLYRNHQSENNFIVLVILKVQNAEECTWPGTVY